MSISRKFQRSKSKYTLSQKIISAVTAAGFIMQPIVGFAQAITKADDAFKNTIINKGNGVTDIWADRVVGNSAVNVFKDFQLDANNIANMYFNELNRTEADAANLVNFVNSRIDINGTVNAIQNSQIGGNLFFLSKDGMAVGKSGVINTGSLYVMTPTENYMKKAMDVVGNPNSTGTQDVVANVIDTAKWHEIPVNASGTITVLGQVNATNKVQMRAAKIGVGKNVDDKVVDGVEAGDIDATNAIIQTGVTNFGDLVNIKGVDGAEDVKSGLTGELIATKTGSGDIILEAYVDNKSNPNAVEDIPQIGGVLSDVVDWGENNFTTQNFDASVDVYGEVNAAGKADITATAVNSNVDVDDLDNYVDNKNTDVAQLANVNAKVNIGSGGKVTAKKDVTVKAEAINRYVDNTGAFETALKLGVTSGSPLTGDAAYSKLDTDATVNIEQGAKVESAGGSVDIDAKAETLAASAASTLGLKFKTVGGYKGANVPAAAVVYTEAHNDAKVTVNGTVTAKNDVNIDADADLTVEAENKMTVTGEKANQFVVGVTIANASNNADVTIGGENNKIEATDGNLAVNATADSDFTSKTSISAGESSAVGVAVNVTNFNSGANVNVNTKLKAGKDLTVNAADTVAADNVMAESKVGSGKYMSSAMQVMGKNGSIDAVKGFASDLAKKMLLPEMSDDIKGVSVADVLHAGATVTYSEQNHNSGVTIGNDASLTAGAKLDIDAQTKIEDAHFTATGVTNSYNDATAAPVTLNAAVLVTNMNNSSSVVVEDAATENGTEHKATLNGDGGVDINAATKFEYNRVQKMKDAVTDAAAQIEHAFTTLDEAFKDDFGKIPAGFKDLKDKYTAAYEAFTGKMNGIEDGTQVTSGADNFIDAIVAGYQVLTALEDLNAMLDESGGSEVMKNANEAFKGASDLFSGALAFVDPNSYGTFAAASTSKGSSGDVGGSAPGGGSVTGAVGGSVASAVNGAGAVMVNSVNSVSKVEIGSDTVIESDRDVNIGAENHMKDVSLGGLNLGLFNNAGGGTSASIGATVNYAQFDTDTIVTVNDGASITGGNIDIDAKNTIDHVSVAASAGKGPSAQTESKGVVLNGMLSFVNGSSDILTVVDDGASLTANQNDYTETNDKDETVEKTTEGNISINGHNNTNITNVAAGASWGKGSAAVGVGLAYTDFEVKNITGVADVAEQIKGLYATNSDGTVNDKELEEARKKFSNTYTEEKADTEEDTISAYGFSVDAATDGSIQSVSAAGSLSNDDASGQIGFFDKINSGLNSLDTKLVGEKGLVDKASSSLIGGGKNKANANELINLGTQTHGGSGGINIVGGSSGGDVNTFMPSFSLAGSGSVSINMLDNTTEAIVDNAKITITQATGQEKGDITVTARDALYAGAYSGAAALQWNAGGTKTDTAVAVSGAAGVNDIANAVKATIKNSEISGAGKVDTMALSGGEQLALGLGMAIVKADGTTGYSGNAAVSVNLIDHDVEALQENNTVTNTDDVNVYAYARDLENTGGGTFSGGQQKIGGGVTVGVAQLHNNISAGIKGGTYTDVESVDVQALNALQNVTVGVAAGVTVPSGDGGSANVQGAGVYNEVHNTTNAFISGSDEDHKAEITTGGTVKVVAQDTAENSDLELRLAGLADGRQTLIDILGDENGLTGKNYFDGIDTSATGEEINLDKNSGSSIVTVGTSVSGTKGDAGVGVAAAITDIENNYTANIDYADITAEKVTADAGSDSNIVTVAGGVAVAGKGSGVGSVSWNDVENTAKVNIANSVIKAQETEATAENTAQIVSVTGQISGGKKGAVGAALGYVGLDNSTEANITNTTFDKRDTSDDGIIVKADAQNSSDSYNIGAGVTAAGDAAVSGTVVVTQTHGTAGAVMDKVTIKNAKTVTANALDDTDILSVIGTVTIAGKAAVGAGVSYTEIGDVSTDTEKGQYVTAEIKNNSTINTDEDEENAAVNVTANDTARVINVAVGVGGGSRAAVQGASATTLINKTTSAEIADTKIDENGGTSANVIVDAQNNSEITSSASTVAIAGQGAGVGAGIAVNRIIQQTNAAVNGGTMNVNNLTVNADATPRIENIGVGGAVAGQGASVSGSVAVNMIQNDVIAHIGSGANIDAYGSVGVVATSDEQIANYAGQAAVAGQGAGVGVSVAVNQIAGTTSATVGGKDEAKTSVTAKGKSSLNTNTFIRGYEYGYDSENKKENSQINNALINQDTVSMNTTINRESETRSGLVVDASSTRDMKSFLLTAGVGGMGAGVTGTVNVNMIKGATNAGVANTIVDGTVGGANAPDKVGVFVNAGDYTNMSGFVGSGGVSGIGAGVGLGSDTNTFSRNVEAVVENSDIKANTFEVDADSQQGISSFAVGAGIAGVGGGVAGIVTVTELENATKAALLNSNVNANTVNINANHTGVVNAGNVSAGVGGVGAGVGLSVGVLKDNSSTEVTVGDDEEAKTQGRTNITAANDVNIAAENTAVVKPMISATGGAGVGAAVAGATSVNNLNSVVKTNINNAYITSNNGNISGTANNTFNVEAYSGGNAIGAAGIGVGANVTVNTIDSTVQTNVNDSTLNAETGNVTLTADENRNIEQLATNIAAGGIAAGANIAITSVGQEIKNTVNEDGETVSNAADKIAEANNAYGANDTETLLGDSAEALETAGIDDIKLSVDAGYGGLEDENGNKISQITVNITNSNIDAGNNVTANATENDNINMTLGSGAAGAAAVNAGVGILNVNRNVGVNITSGSIDAGTVDIGTDITGEAKLDVYQGSAGVIGANAAVGIVNTTGSSQIKISGAELTGNNINILAADHGVTKANTLGITIGAVSVGVITAEADNTGATNVVITDTEANAKDSGQESSISIGTDKANTVEAHATGGAGGSVAAQGVVATAEDSGVSSITLGEDDGSAGNTFTVNNITVQAAAKPVVKAIADSFAVSIFGTAGASVATAEATGNVNVNVYDGNTLSAEDVDITADAGTQEGKNTAEAKVVGNSGSGYAAIAANAATADVTTKVNVNVGDVNYKTKTEKVLVGYKDVGDGSSGEREEDYDYVITGATDLNISGNNASKASADAKGITIGGIFSSGNNLAFTNNTAETNVSLNGGSDNTLLNSMSITASGATDNTAKADGSGGALVSGDLAAYVKNDSQAKVDATLSGNFTVEGDVTVNALQSDTANINADALKATVVGASATLAENNIGGATNANIDGATITGGGKLDVNVANTITFGNTEQYAVEGSGYGGVNVQGAQFDNTINKTAAVNVTGSTLTTNGSQAFEAKTTGNINAGGYIKAAGLGAFTWADINNTVTSDNSVTVDKDSSLKTKKEGADITLASVDNMDLTVSGVADVQGAAVGGASSDVTNVLNRKNKITVSGDLYAMNDVNLYAGKDKNGAEGKLDLAAESETYNYAALPIADPKLSDKVNQHNQVVINKGSDVSSVRNINLYADAGKETIRDTTLMYTWVYSDKGENYTSSTVGDKEPENKDSENFVQADGNLVAGVQNKQYITIGGDGQLVFRDQYILEAVNNYGNQSAVGEPTIEASDSVDTNAIVFGTFDYGVTLFERYNELGELMNSYGEDKTSTAYLGYKAEQTRIMNQLKEMGLVETITTDNEGSYLGVIEGMKIDYIELPDIVASGGNINIQTDTLSGSGSLKAQGAPEVVINNNTNLYMKINNITVGDPGGEINFNNNSLTSDNYQEKIAGLNADKNKEVKFTELVADAGEDNGGRLVINGNYAGGTVLAQVTVDGKTQEIQTTPRADIEINGIVNSQGGTVEISSAANNIIIQGESAEDSAAVKGQTVELSAKGSVSQGFQEGIVNIGGSVQDQYQSQYDDFKNQWNSVYGKEWNENKHEVKYGDKVESQGNMIAGENIYISASDINVNGKIQSGYADYVVNIDNIDNKMQEQIDTIKDNWQNGGSQPLTDAMVTTGTAYRIVEGRDVWSESDKCYYRQLDVYYNPSTGQIVVPDVDANGGQVYLTGRISSTGSGSIKVLDGAYDIDVTNNTGTDLQLGKLVSNNVDGLISITDTAQETITEITRDKTVVKDLSGKVTSTTDSAITEYKPQGDLRYNWTTGQEVTTSTTYEKTIKAGLWGLVETVNNTNLTEYEQTENIKDYSTGEKDKLNGEYIGSVSGIDNDKYFAVIYDNKVLENSQSGPGNPERWSTGFLGWFKWEKYTWTRKLGTSQQYVASVKADNPISIGFIGNVDGNSNIKVNSKGNINLTNNITSASGGTGSVIDITSNKGAINQLGGSINGDNINLKAKTGINDVNITSIGDPVNLNAVTTSGDIGNNVNLNAVTTSGDIGINVNAAYDKEGNVVIGNLFAGTAGTPAGDVSLTAAGNITQSGPGTSVIGNRIDLVSTGGAIGTDKQAIVVHGGQQAVDVLDSLSASVNAQADGNINLTQDTGNMRIGRVYSDRGDVTITVNNGDLIDALPSGETVDRGNTDELIQKWTDLGLIEGEGDYTEQIAQDVADYEAGVENEFDNYQEQKDYYEAQSGSITHEYKDAYASYSEAKTQYDALKDSFDTWNEGKAYYTDSQYVPVRGNYKTDEAFNTALAEYNDGKAAFDKLNEQFNGYETFYEYSKENNVEDTYSAYFKPSVNITGEDGKTETVDMKAAFDGYANYESLKATYGDYTSYEDYLVNNTDAQAKIAELENGGQKEKTYWDKDQLLYALSEAITNPESGATDTVVKDPNIKGNNIMVTVNGGSAGLNSEKTTVINIADLTKPENVDALKQLAGTDASNVIWNETAGTATITEKLPVGIQSTGGGITVITDGNVYLAGRTETDTDNVLNINEITAEGNIRLQGHDGIYNVSAGDRAAITGKDLLIQAGEGGSIGTADKMMTTDISGTMQAQAGENIYISQIGDNDLVLASIGAGEDIVLQAVNNIKNVDSSSAGLADSYIRSDDGTITLISDKGAIGEEDNAIRILDNGAVVNADAEGNIYLSGVSGEGSKEELVLGTVEGANLDVTSVSSIKQTADGKITANEVNASATKDILLGSEENEVNSFVVNGLGDDNSVDGSVDIVSKANNADGVVNVEFGKDVNGNKVGLTVNNGYVNVSSLGDTSNLNITGGSVTTIGENAGGVSFSSGGGINAEVEVNSTTDVDFNVNTGDITLGGNLTANNGNITIDIAGDGSLKDAANKDNELKAFSPDGDEAKGNIVINVGRDKNGAGDVDLYDLYASNEARVDVNNGDLTLHEINGKLVAIQLRTQGKEMNVGEIIAGTQIVLSGSNMDLDQITQREDADGMLVITPDGAEEDKPIDNFTIGDIRTNDDTGIRFERLWVNNSDIHMSQGQLWFDKLYVEDTAHFSNDNMTAAVYGVPPLRDGSDSVYWNNTAENRPEDNLDLWQSGNGDWMYLRFTDDNIQESNGILLTLDEYDYVYDQRFTAEDHLRWQHGRYLDEDWKQAYGYGLSLHDRYGLIDYQHFTEENAGEDEIAVEA